jgi:hypothetical protein
MAAVDSARCDIRGAHYETRGECGNCGTAMTVLVPFGEPIPPRARCERCGCDGMFTHARAFPDAAEYRRRYWQNPVGQ